MRPGLRPVRERLRRSRSFGPACGGCESLHPLLKLEAEGLCLRLLCFLGESVIQAEV